MFGTILNTLSNYVSDFFRYKKSKNCKQENRKFLETNLFGIGKLVLENYQIDGC